MTLHPPLPRSCALTSFGASAAWDCAVIIPAKDEDQRITACLTAVADACQTVKNLCCGIIAVVNNTRDATAATIAAWARLQPDVSVILLDCTFDSACAGVGSARRLGLDLGCRMVGIDGVLLTTDADTLVRPDWIAQNLAELARADLICGTVLGQPDEARALPAAIAAHGSAEWDYVNASIALAAAFDPQPHDPEPPHHNAAGASFAVTARVYAAVGGLPVIQMGEDRAFAAMIEAHDYRVRYSDLAIVETSCRMQGRTVGGMAGALRARACQPDPFADEWLEGARAFVARYQLRGALRAGWPDRDKVQRVLATALNDNLAAAIINTSLPPYCGALIARAELELPRLRLRLSDCRRELPQLQDALAACHNSPLLATRPSNVAIQAAAE